MNADPSAFKKNKEFSCPGILFSMARAPETGRLFFGSSDFKVYEFDTAVEKPAPVAFQPQEKQQGHQSYVTGVALAAGQLVTGSYDGKLIWWDLEQRHVVRRVDAHEKWIRNVIASPDGKRVCSVGDDMQCKVWDAATGAVQHVLQGHQAETPHHYPSMLYANAFSPDGKWLATGDKVGHIVVWNLADGKPAAELEAPGMYTWDPKQRRHSIGGIRSLAFSHDSKFLAAGGIGKIGNIDHLGGPTRVEIFEWQTGKRVHLLEDEKQKGLVEQMEFHPSGQWLLAAGGDHAGYVKFYNTADGKIIHQEKTPMHVHGFEFNEAYDTVYGVGHGKVAVWELKAAPAKEEPAKEEPAKDKPQPDAGEKPAANGA